MASCRLVAFAINNNNPYKTTFSLVYSSGPSSVSPVGKDMERHAIRLCLKRSRMCRCPGYCFFLVTDAPRLILDQLGRHVLQEQETRRSGVGAIDQQPAIFEIIHCVPKCSAVVCRHVLTLHLVLNFFSVYSKARVKGCC